MKLVKAPPKPDIPIAEPKILNNYDAFLFGIPTRFGNMPAQWKGFWDGTGGQWARGDLRGKYAGVFVSTGTPGGGQETTVINTLSTLAHHGIVYVPFGYGSPRLADLNEVHGGSPWGAGTLLELMVLEKLLNWKNQLLNNKVKILLKPLPNSNNEGVSKCSSSCICNLSNTYY